MKHRYSAVIVLAASLSACVYAPEADHQLPTTATQVNLHGMALKPNEQLKVFVSPTDHGPWTQRQTVKSGTSPYTAADGTDFYAFSTSLRVSAADWTGDDCAGGETFVRVISSDGFALPTFDAISPNGKPFLTCLDDEMALGHSALNAIATCDSPQSPLLRLSVASSGVPFDHVGDVLIETPADAAMWVCLRHLTGALSVPSSGLEAVMLPALESVSGDVSLSYDRPGVDTFEDTRPIHAPNLATIGGPLSLTSPAPMASQVVTVRVGLDAVASIGGDVTLSVDASNTTLYGLGSLAAINGNLSLVTGQGDTFMSSFLNSVASVTGDVFVDIGHTVGGVLPALQTVDGHFAHVDGNIIVTGAADDAYANLAAVGGDFTFSGADPNGPPNAQLFPNLATVGGTLTYATVGGRTEIRLGALPLTAAALTVDDNDDLIAVGANNISIVGPGTITFTDNWNLCQSDVQLWLTGQGLWTGFALIGGNGPC